MARFILNAKAITKHYIEKKILADNLDEHENGRKPYHTGQVVFEQSSLGGKMVRHMRTKTHYINKIC